MAGHSKNDAGGSGTAVRLSLLLVGAVVVVSALMAPGVESFSPPAGAAATTPRTGAGASSAFGRVVTQASGERCVALAAKSTSGGGGKKKRRRKRKQKLQQEAAEAPQATTTAAPPPSATIEPSAGEKAPAPVDAAAAADILDVAGYVAPPPQQPSIEAVAPPTIVEEKNEDALPLPDIRDTLMRKKMEIAEKKSGVGGVQMDNLMPKTKIDRNDRTALLKLLEQDPYADGDDSFFETQEYTTISAWLGEGTKPFLGIPTQPLQVGHTIGALVIVLMAFIEYPGFPLTNLPTPLRDALQGGLGTIYSINVLLSIVTVFKAIERDQPVKLWVAKTLTVGGLALDQLTQLPTKEQIAAAEARKGKRALNKNRRK
eukprot:CAMPEP_0197184346 /NCGR_PEP_ID=MMETSP1423-20130617/9684_1 /TAXON_ID=476441 /ORGANISM="Pseudo-nitzschia heimii, Strain UNC1101" /LENGTH=371 /DNA_ID=CAMNT_0042635139 /DNA_START=44 /DNA_END=1159 /DNA_ORIENTATION=-